MSANFKCILFATTTLLCFLGLSTRLALALTITDGFETTRLQQCREGCLEKVCDYNVGPYKEETVWVLCGIKDVCFFTSGMWMQTLMVIFILWR